MGGDLRLRIGPTSLALLFLSQVRQFPLAPLNQGKNVGVGGNAFIEPDDPIAEGIFLTVGLELFL